MESAHQNSSIPFGLVIGLVDRYNENFGLIERCFVCLYILTLDMDNEVCGPRSF